MSVSTFNTPSPIAVTLDLYVADVRFAVSDRTDTSVEVRPSNPDKAADVKAAENTRVEYDDATRTLSIVSRKPRNRFVNFSSKRPESIDVVIQLPTDSDVRGEAGMGDFQADGALGTVTLKTDLGAVRLAETGPLNVRSGLGEITVAGISGSAEVHGGSSDIRIGAVDGTADVSTGNGKVRVGVVTGAASVKAANGSVSVDRALSDLTADQFQRRGAGRRGRARQGVRHVQERCRRGRYPRGQRRLAGAEHRSRPRLQRAHLCRRPRGRRAGRPGRGPREYQAR